MGSYGEIIKTTNGGESWYALESGTVSSLNSLHFINENKGWAVGFFGEILNTIDGGETWRKQVIDSNFRLISVFFVNEQTGWAVGDGGYGVILKTINGGQTWQSQIECNRRRPYLSLQDVFFIDENTGWLLGFDDGTEIYKTEDGGDSWKTFGLPGEKRWYWPSSITFTDDNVGWVLKKDKLYKSSDGGVSWQTQLEQSGYQGSSFQTVDFYNGNIGWVADRNKVWKTTDGGQAWIPYESQSLFDLEFFDDQRGWGVGGEGLILHSADGGESWDSQTKGSMNHFSSISFVNPDTGWVAGSGFYSGDDNSIMRTADGGESWQSQFTRPVVGNESLRALEFFDASVGVAVGNNMILRTGDGGENWGRIKEPAIEGRLWNVTFTPSGVCWIVGDATLLKSVDLGLSWSHKDVIQDAEPGDIQFLNDLNGWCVTLNAKLLSTKDGGESWHMQQPTPTWIYGFTTVHFLDLSNGWIAGYGSYHGDYSVLLTTQDGGQTWED